MASEYCFINHPDLPNEPVQISRSALMRYKKEGWHLATEAEENERKGIKPKTVIKKKTVSK